MNFKHELSPSKPLLRSTLSLILGKIEYNFRIIYKVLQKFKLSKMISTKVNVWEKRCLHKTISVFTDL